LERLGSLFSQFKVAAGMATAVGTAAGAVRGVHSSGTGEECDLRGAIGKSEAEVCNCKWAGLLKLENRRLGVFALIA
jgi:hypothetical protein